MDQPSILTRPPMSFAKKKAIAISIIGIIVLTIVILSILVELEAPPQKEILYSGGAKRALIVFHPSWKYHFQEDLTAAFARGLNSQGWSVDRITTSFKMLSDFNTYDMYIFGTNTYYWSPDLPTKRFLTDINLFQKPAVAIVSGPGYTERAEETMKELLDKANASIVTIHAFSLFRPSEKSLMPDFNHLSSVDTAFLLGQESGKRNSSE
ncbi:MAG: hypothetical protein A2X86_08370 [Bdellovibrionales bacterium GWA2_49_15]|nr:MAG: hypothetical protein A2X86_08370 [Bdellovibrionales bacterium GWA2_49_15]HAZ11224.1 hypothetical protein [Bdellovibrionales bacterium]